MDIKSRSWFLLHQWTESKSLLIHWFHCLDIRSIKVILGGLCLGKVWSVFGISFYLKTSKITQKMIKKRHKWAKIDQKWAKMTKKIAFLISVKETLYNYKNLQWLETNIHFFHASFYHLFHYNNCTFWYGLLMLTASHNLQVFVPFFVKPLSIVFKEKYAFSNGHWMGTN